jgi:hypothetical protein
MIGKGAMRTGIQPSHRAFLLKARTDVGSSLFSCVPLVIF